MNKKNDVFLIIIMILIVLVLFGGVGFLTFNFFRGVHINGKVNSNEVYRNIFEQEFETINIDTKAAKIEIKESIDEQFKIVVYDEDTKYLNVSNNDTLLDIVLTTKACKGFLCFNSLIPKIELYIPKDYKNEIIINNKFGDITVDAYVSKLELKEDYGDITVKEIDDIVAKNALGNIKIEKINHSLDIIDNCGDIKIYDLKLKVDSNIKNDLGDIRIGTTNDIYIDAKTDLGDVKINKNNSNATVTLKIRDSKGDIKVNN